MQDQLSFEHKQTQALTPQMYQSLHFLQMNLLQLAEHLEEFLLENPLLEEDYSGGEALPLSDTEREYDFARQTPETLAEHLISQFDSSLFHESDEMLLTFIALHLDDAGYLNITQEEIARRTGYTPELVEYALSYIQTLDPAGVGARDLKQCLSIQLERLGCNDPIYYAVLEEGLEFAVKGHYAQTAKKLGCQPHEVQKACALIRSLNPKPGSAFGAGAQSFIIPDIRIAVRDGAVTAHVLSAKHTSLHISPYYARMAQQELDGEARAYLSEKLSQAKGIVNAIEMRNSTLQAIADLVAQEQRDFFVSGGAVAALTLKETAQRLGIHESTMSRAVQGKTLECSRGLFPLKHFFSASVGGEQSISKNALKERIKQLIDSEDKERPLSDAQLEALLAKENIKVSRRTLAKYRGEMNIPGVFGRKQ